MKSVDQAAKKPAQSKLFNKLTQLANPDPDLIPFVCHYNEKIILSKNGELITTIKIPIFDHLTQESEFFNLRDTFRTALAKTLNNIDFAFWFHVIRRKADLRINSPYPEKISAYVKKSWDDVNQYESDYVNELYVTVLIKGHKDSLLNIENFFNSMSIDAICAKHFVKLAEAEKILTNAIKELNYEIAGYNSHQLTSYEQGGVYYSEYLQFFNHLITLDEEPLQLPIYDYSQYLSDQAKIAFGNNSIQVIKELESGQKSKRFATMISIKHYNELNLTSLDHLLLLNQEMVITQSAHYVSDASALEEYEYQEYILKVSNDETFANASSLQNIIDSNKGGQFDFVKHQMTIMLIANSLDELTVGLTKISDIASKLGIAIVREDVFAEQCFWAQLPSNFFFLGRQDITATSLLPSLFSLSQIPVGLPMGGKWGEALIALRTILNTPYYLNFGEDEAAAILLIGPKQSGKSSLVNFLTMHMRKFGTRIINFDTDSSSKLTSLSLNGVYYEAHDAYEAIDSPSISTLRLNPFSLAGTEADREFLAELILNMSQIDRDSEEAANVPLIIDSIYQHKGKTTKKLSDVIKLFDNGATNRIYTALQNWCDGGDYGWVFDNKKENLDLSSTMTTINLAKYIKHKSVAMPVMLYLLYRIKQECENDDNLAFVFEDILRICGNDLLSSKLEHLIDYSKDKKIAMFFTTKTYNKMDRLNLPAILNTKSTTKIFLANHNPDQYYTKIFGLTRDELRMIKNVRFDKPQLLLQNHEGSIIINFDLSPLDALMPIIGSNEADLMVADNVITRYGNDADEWLPEFFQIMEELMHPNEENDEDDEDEDEDDDA